MFQDALIRAEYAHERALLAPAILAGAYQRGDAFSPLDIPGLELWLKADAITGLNDGDPVVTWGDSSGNGNDLTQGTPAARPLWIQSAVNGKPAVRFDGTDDLLALAFTLAQPTTVLVVYKNTRSTGQTDVVDGNAAAAMIVGNIGTATQAAIYAGTVLNGPNTLVVGTWFLEEGVFSGASSACYVNTVGLTGNAGTASPDGVTVGGRADGTSLLEGDVPEVLVYNAALSDANRALLETHLNDKYAIY